MSYSKIILLFATLFSVVVVPTQMSSSTNLSTDKSALAALKYYVTSDPKNILKNGWSDSTFVCNWTGVTCGTDPLRVVGLNLSYAGLVGNVPPHLGNLSSLVDLYMKNNSFHGVFPSELSRLTQLENFHFGFNSLTGEIPSWLASLHKLQRLGLYSNQFYGSIPIPIFNTTSLKIIDLSDNQLSGTVAKEIGNLGNLEVLDLSVNNITGTIPSSLFNITTIQVISLYSNQLSGGLPLNVAPNAPNLRELCLHQNHLSGSLPASISNASELTKIDIANNNFSGTIPNTLSSLKKLQWLFLGDNHFTLTESTSNNILSTIASLSYLRVFALTGNPLNATLSSTIRSNVSNSLERLYLNNCILRGNIPATISNFSSLILLSLGENGFSGSIPPSIGMLRKLQGLSLSENILDGPIPLHLCQLQSLYGIGLYNNMLSGSIPSCFSNITSLRQLYLDSNKFSLKIPSTLWRLNDIVDVTLSSNSLTGHIPADIGNLQALRLFTASNNQFSGSIPSSIGDLKSLTYLDLSNNNFKGLIPESMGKSLSLEVLNLSNNNLSGVIPKSFEKLSHLKFLNLSFNKLYGEIPNGGPFSNFSAQSFIENDNLCGPLRLQVPPCKSPPRKVEKATILIKLVIPSTVAAIIFVTALIIIAIRRKKRKNPDSEAALGTQKRVSRFEISAATNGFDEENLVGVGSFGSVYKGALSDGLVVAIKVFNLQIEEAFQSFSTECEVLCSIRHRNLVKVITCCSSPDFKALVLQYMPHGSLENLLYSGGAFLNLMQRLNIMIDVASALEYLHYNYSTPIVHCDLKPSNVLLDENMVAHVADFGITKLLSGEGSMTRTMTLATIGYMAPEYGVGGFVSRRGDAYSFGIMLMEVFTKKKPVDDIFSEEMSLRQWVQNSFQNQINELIDSDLLRSEDHREHIVNKDCVTSILEMALSCSASLPEERIDMKTAVSTLNKIKIEYLKNEGI